MLVGIVTLKSAPWELEDNFHRLEAYVREAAGRRAQVIVAPESVLDGYVFNADPTSQLADMLEIAQTVPDGSYIQRAGALCKELGTYLIFGLLEREEPDPVQRLCHARSARRGDRPLPQNYHRGRVRHHARACATAVRHAPRTVGLSAV